MSLRNSLIRNGTQIVLRLSTWFARRQRFNHLTQALMEGMARSAVRSRKIAPAASVADLGEQWQKAFPSRKQIPITAVTGDTVFAEIHTPCPLRGTGDVHACYRMMAFDREVLRRAGGQFIVLQSQAAPGNNYCKVAMRRASANTQDLVPAHLASPDPENPGLH